MSDSDTIHDTRRRAHAGLALLAFAISGIGCHSLRQSAAYNAVAAVVFSSLDEQSDITTVEHRTPSEGAETIVDLGIAFRLAGVDNPTINLVEEQIREARAGELAARSLMLPSVNIGGNLRVHRGALLDDPGIIRTPQLQSLYLGAGAGAIGAGTIAIPGVWLFAQLGDAIYEPLAARQRVSARQSDARATQNSILLEVAGAYLDLAGAEARRAILREAEADVSKIVQVTSDFAMKGAGTPADANRATANAEFVRRQIAENEGAWAAASARLSRLLALDPTIRLRAPEQSIQPLRIIDENANADTLIESALRMRPELSARAANLQEANVRVRQERARPWLPQLAVGYSAGGFGGGSNQVADDFSPLKGRWDIGVLAVWNVQNLGTGNRARVRFADAFAGEAMATFDVTLNQVRREVSEAQAASKVAFAQIEFAKRAFANAEEGFRLEADRIKQGQGRPIEALDSFRQLLDARQEMLRAVIAYQISQFRLIVALGGNPATTIAGCE